MMQMGRILVRLMVERMMNTVVLVWRKYHKYLLHDLFDGMAPLQIILQKGGVSKLQSSLAIKPILIKMATKLAHTLCYSHIQIFCYKYSYIDTSMLVFIK